MGQDEILKILKKRPGLSPQQLAKRLKKTDASINRALFKMYTANEILRESRLKKKRANGNGGNCVYYVYSISPDY